MSAERYTLPALWNQALDEWVQWLSAGGLSVETVRLRRTIVRSIARRSDTTSPADITGDYLIALFAVQRWSTDHRRNAYTTLVGFYAWSVQAGITPGNPAAALPKMPDSRPKPKPVTDQVWRELLEAAAPREKLMARLAAEAGLRRAEVAKVRIDDVLDTGSGPLLVVHGKGDKTRIVPISDSLAELIRQGPAGHTPGAGAGGFLFPGHTDGHISPVRVGALVSALMPPGWSMHKLRHRYATRAYRGSRNLRAVQTLLGHSSIATTERYTAVDDDEIRAAAMAATAD